MFQYRICKELEGGAEMGELEASKEWTERRSNEEKSWIQQKRTPIPPEAITLLLLIPLPVRSGLTSEHGFGKHSVAMKIGYYPTRQNGGVVTREVDIIQGSR